ncbi:MAG: hypothetical protein HN654_03705, partial [Candidatus Marinimicrobia bacterium]|nr:hypothetical protein [Candidatus Neomarinimicrobiota bacterium]
MKYTKKNNLKGPTLLLPLLGALVTVLFLGIGCNSVVTDANTKRPNIVFFIADDMYPEMFNFLPEGEGKNLSPNIDRLASGGIRYSNFHTT